MCSSLIEPSQFAVWINTVNAIEQSEWKFQPFSLTVNMSLTKRQWSPSLKFPFGNLHSREPNEMPVKISSNGLSTAKAYGLRMRVGNKKRSDSPMYSLCSFLLLEVMWIISCGRILVSAILSFTFKNPLFLRSSFTFCVRLTVDFIHVAGFTEHFFNTRISHLLSRAHA